MAKHSQTHVELTERKSDTLPESRGESREAQISSFFGEVTTGPLPPPRVIEGYESLLPGSADRILKLAEAQIYSDIKVTERSQEIDARDSLIGLISATLISLACIVAGVIIIIKSPSTAGAIGGSLLGLSGMGSVVISIVRTTRRGESDEPHKK